MPGGSRLPSAATPDPAPSPRWLGMSIHDRTKWLVALLATSSALAVSMPAAAPAKSCSRGKHAVVSGEHKCLARGQFCARAKDSTYHRYGFHCHKRDARGNYHLS